mmetsp:Transcript_24135/g.37430  ORF Transcript_24135/g.37430 Transcript_24135/m.37430 type:complete len:158 (+) Transcript_24135:87-560(+)
MGDAFTSIARRVSNSPVGLGVGPVGVWLGLNDGLNVGGTEIDGNAVGKYVGEFDGDNVGETIGLLVGEPGMTGDEVGDLEGVRVGGFDGANVGCNVVGLNVGLNVVGTFTGDDVVTFIDDDVGLGVGLGERMSDVGVAVIMPSSSPPKQMLDLSQLK